MFRFYKTAYTSLTFILLWVSCVPSKAEGNSNDTTPTSTVKDAILIINQIKGLPQSAFWPHVKPDVFIANLKENIIQPLGIYEGSYTNFCGYAALTYLPLHYDPVSYLNFMLELYKTGRGKYRQVHFEPHEIIRNTAGTLRFKGKLDIRPADQMWFLILADHFKGYLNFFSRNYKNGAENTFWASVNYGKFNRMIKQLFNFKVEAKGSDLLHPHIKSISSYLKNCLLNGTTFIYLNNQFLLKKNDNLKPGIPTHYIVLLSLVEENNGSLTMTYWDYGFKSLRQLTPAFLKRIVFGITHCTLKKI